MKNASAIKNASSKKLKKKLTPKQLIIKLAELISKDAAEANLPKAKQKRIVDQLGLVLEEVDAYLPDAYATVCWCVYDGSGACITPTNCGLLRGTNDGPCP
jgi:hypothetical protein